MGIDIPTALIINDRVVYSVNTEDETKFETVIFAQALIGKLGRGKWTLERIKMHLIPDDRDILLLTKRIGYLDDAENGNGNNIIYLCTFTEGSEPDVRIQSLLDGLAKILNDKVDELYGDPDGAGIIMEDIIGSAGSDDELNVTDSPNDDDCNNGTETKSVLIYAGLSSQGLPIVSKIYRPEFLIKEDGDMEKKLMIMESSISGQMATISMNSYIRAKARVEEIRFRPGGKFGCGFINFYNVGLGGMYTLELIILGKNPDSGFGEKLAAELRKFGCLRHPFAGELKPYKELNEFFGTLEL